MTDFNSLAAPPAPSTPAAEVDASQVEVAAAPSPSENTESAVEPDTQPSAETAAAPDSAKGRKPRAAPIDLESDLKVILDGVVTGAIAVPDGKFPTPHFLSIEVAKLRNDGVDSIGLRPSGGAVAAALVRWRDIGFITLTDKPMAFEDYTDAGRDEGLSTLKAKARQVVASARAAQREAKKAAAAEAPETVAVPPAGQVDPGPEAASASEPTAPRAPF